MSTSNNNVAVVNEVVATPVKRVISAWKPGQGRKDFESTARTWGQLKEELRTQGFSTTDVRVTEGNTQVDLVNEDAILPTNISKRGVITNDLIIIMTPTTKIKSGAINIKTATYKELKAEIKNIFANSPTTAKAHFGNYTQLSTDAMRSMLDSWHTANKPSSHTSGGPKGKLSKVQENLEANNLEICVAEFSHESYMKGISQVLSGINTLQNEVFDLTEHVSPTDAEIKELAKKFSK